MRVRSVVLVLAVSLLLGVSACGEDTTRDSLSREQVAQREAAQSKVAHGDSQRERLAADSAAVLANGVPGVVVVTAENGRQTSTAWGEGEVATHTPLAVSDRFRIGSVSKSYVAVIMLQLADEKKLSLDDTVEKWQPGLVPNGAHITIRELLNHSSGIPNYEDNPAYLAPYLAGDVTRVTTPQQLVALANALKPAFAPGTGAAYSNTNYTVAGLIIEKATGTSLAHQLDQRVFRPLGLRSSYLPTGPEIDGPHAHGYFVIGKPPAKATDVTRFSPSIAYAGGGIVATAGDVSAFYRALLGGRLLPPALLKQMMTTVTGGKGEKFGLGLVPRTLRCGTVWGLDGNFPGYLVQSYASPDAKRQATIALNLDPNSMSGKAAAATEKLFEDAFCG